MDENLATKQFVDIETGKPISNPVYIGDVYDAEGADAVLRLFGQDKTRDTCGRVGDYRITDDPVLAENHLWPDGGAIDPVAWPELHAYAARLGWQTDVEGHFLLPDLRGKYLVGADSRDPDFAAGAVGGEKAVALTAEHNGPHNHLLFSSSGGTVWNGFGSAAKGDVSSPVTTSASGQGTPHNNLPPYRAVYIQIRAKPDPVVAHEVAADDSKKVGGFLPHQWQSSYTAHGPDSTNYLSADWDAALNRLYIKENTASGQQYDNVAVNAAKKLVTARKIGEADFDGSADITLAQMGAATAAQGTKADNAMPKTGGIFSGPIIASGITSTTAMAVNEQLFLSALTQNYGIKAEAASGYTMVWGMAGAKITDMNGTLKPVLASNISGSSSRRYKHKIQDMDENTAKLLLQLRPIRYEYKKERNDPGPKYGLIAEELAELDPTCVYEDGNGQAEGINYTMLVPQLIKLCQIQQDQIDALGRRLSALETKEG